MALPGRNHRPCLLLVCLQLACLTSSSTEPGPERGETARGPVSRPVGVGKVGAWLTATPLPLSSPRRHIDRATLTERTLT